MQLADGCEYDVFRARTARPGRRAETGEIFWRHWQSVGARATVMLDRSVTDTCNRWFAVRGWLELVREKGMSMRWIAVCALGLMGMGCLGSRSGMEPAAEFPDRAELEEVAERRVEQQEAQPVVVVDRWSFERDSEAEGDESPDQTPWRQLLEQAFRSSKGHVRAAPSLHCAAEHVGRFVIEKQGLPDQRLLQFMTSRCNSYIANPQASFSTTEIPADVPDQQIFEQWKAGLAQDLRQSTEGATGGERVGVWFGRDGAHAVFVLVRGLERTELRPPEIDASGHVRVEGKVSLHREPAVVYALVNQGEHGVVPCRRDHKQRLPQFAVDCQLAAGDELAWIDIMARPRARLMGYRVGRVLAHRGEGPLDYSAGDRQPRPVSSPKEFSQAIVTELNRVRAAAKLRPVSLASAQSSMNQKVAAQFFDAEIRGEEEVVDLIALGLLAGWDVPGTIRGGSVFADTWRGSHDASAWLAQCLESPFGRSALLSPDVRKIALGAAVDVPIPGLGVVATTYTFFETTDYSTEENVILDLLRKQRAARGRSAPTVLPNQPLVEQAALIRTQQKHPMDALQAAMAVVGQEHHASVQGAYLMGNALEFAELAPELLEAEPLKLALAVTHVKVPGAAWGQYVVLFAMVQQSSRNTAAVPGTVSDG